MNGLEVDKETFSGMSDKNQHLVLYDLIKSRHVPETCTGLKNIWVHVKIQWWWLSAVSLSILAGAFFIIRNA